MPTRTFPAAADQAEIQQDRDDDDHELEAGDLTCAVDRNLWDAISPISYN